MIRVESSAGAAAEAAARLVGESLRERAEHTSGPLFWALSGGGSPRGLYERLAQAGLESGPWPRVHVLWGDERCVPPDDARSNYRMVHETGLLDLPFAGVHPMPGGLPPEEGAAQYERRLRALLSAEVCPRLDLVVLGMGDDGHVASLLPGSPALDERTRWVTSTESYRGTRRLTLTVPVLAAARHLLFLVTGEVKADAVRSVLRDKHGTGSPRPARVLLEEVAGRSQGPACAADEGPPSTVVTWIVDEAAASLLHSPEEPAS